MTTKNPSNLIKIDKYTNKIVLPTLLLKNRGLHTIGNIPKYENWDCSLVGNGVDEITFDVYKYANGVKCPVWDQLIDLKIVNVVGYGNFQISVNYKDEAHTIKSIHGQSLEVELGQILLREFHVNDDEYYDNEYDDYTSDNYDDDGNLIPIVFYNEKDTKHSLLHKILADKAPHWRIGHVPDYVSLSEDNEAELVNTFTRTYTEDGTSIYDFLTGTVAEETNVIFVFDTLNRIINCYSLCDCYVTQEDGTRKLVGSAIGEDTGILVSKEKLATEISIESNSDSVKNCFRVEGGDDLITSMVAAVNMNGSNYIWAFDNFQLNDMSEELRNKLLSYQENMLTQAEKDKYYGENGIYTRLCEAYSELYYKKSSMMPGTTNVDPGEAKDQYNNIVDGLKSTKVYVSNITNYTSEAYTGITNTIEAYMAILLDSRFDVKIIDGTTSYSNSVWQGKIQVTQYTDETNVYPVDMDSAGYIKVNIGNGYNTTDENGNETNVDGELEYMRQKTQKALAKLDLQNFDFNNMDDDELIESFNQYSLERLQSFYSAYEECRTILSSFGTKNDSDIRKELYDEYTRVIEILKSKDENGVEIGVLVEREKEVEEINELIKDIEIEQSNFQNTHDFQNYLNDDELYKEFCAYRREDTYTNSNYISDSLESTVEQLDMAKKLLDVAQKEINKSCVLQRTISITLNNLFAIPEFEPLYEDFALFKYIRVRTEDEILKVRLIGIDFSGDSIEDISVTFSEQIESVDGKVSDVASILQQASSMVTSYSSTVLQAEQGSKANNQIKEMYNSGLNAAKMMLKNNDNNEVTFNNEGILAKRMDEEGYYGDKQLRITGNGMYLTDDAWKSVAMAVGEIDFNGNKVYGIIAECLIGKMMVSEKMLIGNEKGTVQITGDGIVIKNGTITWSKDGTSGVNSPDIEDIEGLPDELTSLEEYIEQVDGRIQTFSQSTDPRLDIESWGEDSDHIGDLWVNTETGEIKQWNGSSWDDVTDPYLESLAKTKAQIFTAKPTVAYYKGDMLIPSDDFKVGNVTFYKDKAYRATQDSNGTTFSATDWDALDYTNDDAIYNFINGDYAEDLQAVYSQVDGKARSWYQDDDPIDSEEWNATEDHEGDLWYDSSEDSQITYIYRKGAWEQTNVPKAIFDDIDGKRQIFTSKEKIASYMTGDLWVISKNDCTDGVITVNGTTYNANTTLIAILPDGTTKREKYDETDWTDISTHDGIVALDKSTQALELLDDIASDKKITPSEKQQLKMLMDGIDSEYYQVLNQCAQYNISTSDSDYYAYWTDYKNKYDSLNEYISPIISDLTTTTTIDPDEFNEYFASYYSSLEEIILKIAEAIKAYSDNNLESYKEEIKKFQTDVNAALTGGTTSIGKDYIISPKIGGGYLYIKDGRTTDNTGISVEINPNGTSFDGHNSDYVFNVQKDSNIIMGVTNDGQGYFSGGGKFSGIIDIDGTDGVGAITITGNSTTDRVQVSGTSTNKRYTTTYSRADYQKFYVGDNVAVSNSSNGVLMSVYDVLSNYPHITGWADGDGGTHAYLTAQTGFELDSRGFLTLYTDRGSKGHYINLSPSDGSTLYGGIKSTSFEFIDSSNNLVLGQNSVTKLEFVYNSGNPYLAISTPTAGDWGVYLWASDTRLKKNIIETEQTALDKVNSIEFVQFDWKEGGHHVDLGLSANQLETVIPDAVFNVEQNEDYEYDELKNINNSTLTVYALKAITELSSQIDELKQQIQELKGES